MTTAADLLDSIKRARTAVALAEEEVRKAEAVVRDRKKALTAARVKAERAIEEALADHRQPSLFDAIPEPVATAPAPEPALVERTAPSVPANEVFSLVSAEASGLPEKPREAFPDDQAGEWEFLLQDPKRTSPHDTELRNLIAHWRKRQSSGWDQPEWGMWSEFKARLTDGREVAVCYRPGDSSDHLEFRGDATSETGYRSDFQQFGAERDNRPQITLEAFALQRAEELAAELKPKVKSAKIPRAKKLQPAPSLTEPTESSIAQKELESSSEPDVDLALRAALLARETEHPDWSDKWSVFAKELQAGGATDGHLLGRIAQAFGIGGNGKSPAGRPYQYHPGKASKDPGFWFDVRSRFDAEPSLSGKALLMAVRRLYAIPTAEEWKATPSTTEAIAALAAPRPATKLATLDNFPDAVADALLMKGITTVETLLEQLAAYDARIGDAGEMPLRNRLVAFLVAEIGCRIRPSEHAADAVAKHLAPKARRFVVEAGNETIGYEGDGAGGLVEQHREVWHVVDTAQKKPHERYCNEWPTEAQALADAEQLEETAKKLDAEPKPPKSSKRKSAKSQLKDAREAAVAAGKDTVRISFKPSKKASAK